MSYETILYEDLGEGARIVINRPERRNALNGLCRRELTDALTRAAREKRAVLLTGTGKGFCSGQDLTDAGGPALDLEKVLREEYEPLLAAIYDCPIPTICAVNGAAAGAGANLALAADIVIAAESAVFIEAFARIGLIPDAGGTYWLPRAIGLPRAMGMCLTTDPVSAAQAEQWGLIWKVHPDDALTAEAEKLLHKLATGPTTALKLTKQALRGSLANSLEEQLTMEARLQGEAGRHPDFPEGVAAFLEKRKPAYKGL